MSPLPGVPDDMAVIAGPLLLGYCFNWGLFGVLCMQMYMYHIGFPGDFSGVKILVYGLFFVDTVQTALTTHNAWHFLVSGWGDPDALIKPGWSWIAVPLLSGIVSCTVQIFFAWRIAKISGNKWLAGAIVFIALLQGVCACVSGIWFEVINNVTEISFLFPTATIWLAGSAVADIVIAFSMIYLLRKSSTGFTSTDQILRRLIRNAVETGSVTAACAVLELILYLHWKENNLHMIPALALSKLYTNTLVATLNSRNPQYRTGRGTETEGGGLHFNGKTTVGGNLVTKPNMTLDRSGRRISNPTKVQVMTLQETHLEITDSNSNIAMRSLDKDGFDPEADDDSFNLEGKVNSDSLQIQAPPPRLGAPNPFDTAYRYGQRRDDDVEANRGTAQ